MKSTAQEQISQLQDEIDLQRVNNQTTEDEIDMLRLKIKKLDKEIDRESTPDLDSLEKIKRDLQVKLDQLKTTVPRKEKQVESKLSLVEKMESEGLLDDQELEAILQKQLEQQDNLIASLKADIIKAQKQVDEQ